jgi:hypothetical protein
MQRESMRALTVESGSTWRRKRKRDGEYAVAHYDFGTTLANDYL